MIQPAAPKISIASTVPEIFSALPCPNGCLKSGGLALVLTAINAITAASKSTPECMASEMIETEPVKQPTITLSATSVTLEATDSQATADFLRSSVICDSWEYLNNSPM